MLRRENIITDIGDVLLLAKVKSRDHDLIMDEKLLSYTVFYALSDDITLHSVHWHNMDIFQFKLIEILRVVSAVICSILRYETWTRDRIEGDNHNGRSYERFVYRRIFEFYACKY